MVRELIARRFGYPLQGLVKGTRTNKLLAFLRESQYWDEQKLYDYRLDKLKRLIEHCYENVPYYGRLFRECKLKPSDIRKIEDIKKIPILTKDIARKEPSDLIARGRYVKYVKKGKTGGTTGVPFIFYNDSNSRSMSWAAYNRWLEWMGICYYGRTVSLWGQNRVIKESKLKKIYANCVDYATNNITINAYRLNVGNMNAVLHKINKFHPLFIKGYASSMIRLAQYMNQNSITIGSIRAISTTTETLLPYYREYLESVFKVPVYDQYGCGEVTSIGFECGAHNGLHINMEHVICEVLGSGGDEVMNEDGLVIATDLDNYTMPFLRYDTGDIARKSDEPCSCHVNQPRLLSIQGRLADVITLYNGQVVHGVFVTTLFHELGIHTDVISRFQAIQRRPGEIYLLLESDNQDAQLHLNKLYQELIKHFSKVQVKIVGKINNEPNGKFRYIKNLSDSNISDTTFL